MPFLTGPALWIIVCLLCTNGIAGVMWYVKSNEADIKRAELNVCQTKFDSFKQQVEVLGRQQEQKAAEVIAASNLAVHETKAKYEANLDRLRADYQRMRKQYAQRGASTSPVPAPDIGTRPIDAAAQDAVSDPVRLAAECAETTLTLIWLQEHERQQDRIKEN